MKIKFLLTTFMVSALISCQNPEHGADNKSIRPIQGVSEKHYKIEDFEEVSENQLADFDLWIEWNHSDFEFAVKIKDGELIVGEPTFSEPYFELDGGKLEIINNGEFGGALNFIPNDERLDTVTILEAATRFVFNFEGKIYFMLGIAHLNDHGGAILELKRDQEKFSYQIVLYLDSAPESVAVYGDKILIAGHRLFTVVKNFKKENFIEAANWTSLYPNSIAVKNDHEVYVGIRGGYAELSLKSKKVKYYKYIGD